MKKLFLFLVLGMFMISFVSALEFDNWVKEKTITKDTSFTVGTKEVEYKQLWERYSPIEIDNAFGLGETLWSGAIDEHTNSCGTNCKSTIEIYLANEGSLIDDIKFIGKVESYDLYIQTGENSKEVDDYEVQCVGTKNFLSNGTELQSCSNNKIGSHLEVTPIWGEYNLGDEVLAGNHVIKLEGEKNSQQEVDWVIETQGKWLDDWAVWGASSLGVGLTNYWAFDNNTDLVSGEMNLTPEDGQVTFQSSSLNGNAGDFDATHNMLFDSSQTGSGFLFPVNTTLSIWANRTGGETYISKRTGGSGWFFLSSGGLKMNGLTASSLDTTDTNNVWVNYVIRRNDTRVSLWKDGVLASSQASSVTDGAIDVSLGNGDTIGQQDFIGEFDEIGLWERSLTDAELVELATGVFYDELVGGGAVILNSPADAFASSTQGNIFNATATQIDATIANMSLWTNQSGTFQVENSTTGLSGNTNNTIWDHNLGADGTFLWNVQACDSDGDCAFSASNITIVIDSASPSITIISPTNTFNYGFAGKNETLNWSISDTNLDSIWYNYNGANITIFGAANSTIFQIDSINKSITVYANDTTGLENSTTSTWDYRVFENARAFNSTSSFGSKESFILNVTANSSLTSTALIYNGISYPTSKTGEIINNTITIDTPGTNSFLWNFTYGTLEFSSTNSSQTVGGIILDLCNTTLNNSFINFTFKNETVSEEAVNATITSTWNYWIDDPATFQTLTFSNATENPSYAFCFSPADSAINVNYTIDYNNAVSQQRTKTAVALLTNVTDNQVLYLLPTSLGLFSPFQTVNVNGDSISGVVGTISRVLNSVSVQIDSKQTDSSGFATYFLNPDISYSAVFSKLGFTSNSFTFTPTTDIRTVIMGGGGVSAVGNGTQIAQNTTYSVTPTNATLLNNTQYDFSLTVSSTQTITFISMNITNASGNQVLFNSNAGQGTILTAFNTGNNTKLIGRYVINTASESISFTKVWFIGNEFVGDYSIFRQFTLFMGYGFSDFIRFLLVLSMIIGVLIFMTAGEITDTSESKIAVSILMIWVFSLVGWLDTGIIVATTDVGVNSLGQFSNQYGIAMLTTAGGMFFILRRLFIRRI